MRPTGVVSKKVTGARTREMREVSWMTRDARSADTRLQYDRTTVSSVKPGGGRWGGEGGRVGGRREAQGAQQPSNQPW